MRLVDFIICDDIRQEIGNKVTLVGLYVNTLELLSEPPGWPVHLPKLCFFMRLAFEQGEEAPDHLELAFLRDGNESSISEISILSAPAPFLQIFTTASPFSIKAPGSITIRVVFQRSGQIIGKYEYPLEIKVAPTKTSS